MLGNVEVFLGSLAIISGIIAIIITQKARRRFTTGLLSEYTTWVLYSILYLTVGLMWRYLQDFYGWKEMFGVYMGYPEFIMYFLGFFCFVYAALKVDDMSKVYGFKEEGKSIKKEMEKKNECP